MLAHYSTRMSGIRLGVATSKSDKVESNRLSDIHNVWGDECRAVKPRSSLLISQGSCDPRIFKTTMCCIGGSDWTLEWQLDIAGVWVGEAGLAGSDKAEHPNPGRSSLCLKEVPIHGKSKTKELTRNIIKDLLKPLPSKYQDLRAMTSATRMSIFPTPVALASQGRPHHDQEIYLGRHRWE